MAVLWVADWSAAYEPPHLMMALNLFFMLPVSLLVAYQAGRSFLLRGNPKLLWFGCGMLFLGSAGPLSGILLPHGPDAVVAVHNTLIWLAAACHLAGVLLAPRQRAVVRRPEPWLAGGYIGTLLAVTAVVLTTLSGNMPTFFVQGEGGTLLRQIVLGSAIIMFVSTAILLRGGNGRGVSSAFRYWYALALLLMAVGLFGVMVQSTVGSALGWTGRIAQYLGGVYLLVAAVVGHLLLGRQYPAAALVLASALGGLLVSHLLKGFYDRPRPALVPHLARVSTPSFPSGHAMLSAAVYLTLGALLARLVGGWAKLYLVAVAVVLTLLVGVSRVYLGVHYPTDVVAGWSAGSAWAILCWLTARHLQRRGLVAGDKR
jgi:membrane-associated phospholipid phosphatase